MPYAEEEDTRKVQTAVIGRAESDWPVFLPYDHDDFDRFMRGRTRDDFYCGVLLGGCGKKLSPRRYTDKKCHFAHRPPVHCRRTETGEDSADHLYIGRAVADWLKQQGQRAVQPVYKHKEHQVRDVVDVSYEAGQPAHTRPARPEVEAGVGGGRRGASSPALGTRLVLRA